MWAAAPAGAKEQQNWTENTNTPLPFLTADAINLLPQPLLPILLRHDGRSLELSVRQTLPSFLP